MGKKKRTDIRQTIKAAMQERKISISALSRSTEISRPNISGYLNGRATITVETLERIIPDLGLELVARS